MLNKIFVLYGRHVNLIPFEASGADTDPVAAHADAVTVAEQDHAFASIGGPGETTAYEDGAGPPARAVHGLRRLVPQRPDPTGRALPMGQPAHRRHLAERDRRLHHRQTERKGRRLGGRPVAAFAQTVLHRRQRDVPAAGTGVQRAHRVAREETAGRTRQPGVAGRPHLHPQPHDAAHPGRNAGREAEDIRRDERRVRRRPDHADLPHEGLRHHRLFPRVDHHRHRPHRYLDAGPLLRPERVVARVRRVQPGGPGPRGCRRRRPPLPLVVRRQHQPRLAGRAGHPPGVPAVLHGRAAGRPAPDAPDLHRGSVPGPAHRWRPDHTAPGLRLPGSGPAPELLLAGRLHVPLVRRRREGARRGRHRRQRPHAARQRRGALQGRRRAHRAGADVLDRRRGDDVRDPARQGAVVPGVAGVTRRRPGTSHPVEKGG